MQDRFLPNLVENLTKYKDYLLNNNKNKNKSYKTIQTNAKGNNYKKLQNALNDTATYTKTHKIYTKALLLHVEMCRLDLHPDLVLFNAAAAACLQGSQWRLVLRLLQDMKGICMLPDVATHAAVFGACEDGGAPHFALQLLQALGVSICHTARLIHDKNSHNKFGLMVEGEGILHSWGRPGWLVLDCACF